MNLGHGVFVGGADVGLSVGFGVDDGGGGNVFVGGTEVGFTVGLGVGVNVGVNVGAGVDENAGVADGNSEVGVSLGRAAAVIFPSTASVAATAVSISSNESGCGDGVSVGSTQIRPIACR